MEVITQKERAQALRMVESVIARCETVQPKFVPGSAQHSLLKNRLHAMRLCKALLKNESADDTQQALLRAQPPVDSSIQKCERAQSKYEPGTPQYARFNGILQALYVCRALLAQALAARE